MRRPPAFQFYVDNFIEGTCDMTDAEVGFYIRLLCAQWSRGGLPNDDAELMRFSRGCTTLDLQRIKRKFQLGEDGLLRNRRLELERQKQLEWRQKSAEGGKKSASARQKRKGGSTVVTPPYEGKGQPNGNTPVSGFRSPSPDPGFRLQSPDASERGVGKTTMPDDAWLASLKADPTYNGIDIDRELGKCRAWCTANRKSATRKRFVNWINRERPIAANGGSTTATQPQKPLGIFELKAILQAKETEAADLRNRYASETGLHTTWSDEEARKRHAQLRQEIKGVNHKISTYAH